MRVGVICGYEHQTMKLLGLYFALIIASLRIVFATPNTAIDTRMSNYKVSGSHLLVARSDVNSNISGRIADLL